MALASILTGRFITSTSSGAWYITETIPDEFVDDTFTSGGYVIFPVLPVADICHSTSAEIGFPFLSLNDRFIDTDPPS